MLKTIIVDDELDSVEMIKSHVVEFSDSIELCCTCMDIENAISCIRQYNPDLLLLDIELGNGLSFEILEKMPDIKTQIIFITAYDHYALKAIKFHAYDYILKPLAGDELKAVLEKVIQLSKQNIQRDNTTLLSDLKKEPLEKIGLPAKGALIYYNVNEIVYIEASGSYATVCLSNNKKTVVSRNLKDFEGPLAYNGFLRVHKSYLVNMQHITEFHKEDGGYLLMANNKQVPIGTKDKDFIIEQIKQRIITI